jgi:hypothetical protein
LPRDVIHTDAGYEAARREFAQLTEDERREAGTEVDAHWAACLKVALARLWQACDILDIDPTTLNADHVALYAATMLSKSDAANVV